MYQIVSLVSILITFYALWKPSIACEWKIGSLTPEQTVEVGSPVEITCTLSSNSLNLSRKNYYVNASYLTIEKTNNTYRSPVDDKNVHIISPLALTWRVNSTTDEDTGTYACSLLVGNESWLVCLTAITVGRKPQKSRNFRCTSNYKALECRWKAGPSIPPTRSVLKDVSYQSLNDSPKITECPSITIENNTWVCRWTDSASPPFNFSREKFEFHIETSNTLGDTSDTYHINHNEIVLPDKPGNLDVLSRTPNMIELAWPRPAQMEHFPDTLIYQITLQPQNQLKSKIINTSESTRNISCEVSGLVPNTVYDIFVRCRSPYAKGEDMWSNNVTITIQTMPDVPYRPPNITKEAFEVIKFPHYRTIVIHWQNLQKEDWNGKDFHYKISVDQIDNKREEHVDDVTSNAAYAKFSKLNLNSSYHFKIFSANHCGSSKNYSSIIVSSDEKLLNVPEDITVIFSDKKYSISWKPPTQDSSIIKSYMLFWCSKSYSYTDHCEGSLDWKHVTKTYQLLNITDQKKNFQFAVAANSENFTSGMAWGPCVISSNSKPSKPDLDFSHKSSRSLHVTLKLKCRAEKALIKKFYINYCHVSSEDKNCLGAEKIELLNNVESYNITNLTPFTLYGAYFSALTYNNESVSGDIRYQRTSSDAPDDPPSDLKALNVTNSSIEISWKPPKHPNGNITSYMLKYNEIYHYTNSSDSNKVVLTEKIMPFTKYTIMLRACVDSKCSPSSEPLSVLTGVGIPGEMKEPQVEVNASWVNIWWDPPLHPNGPIDYYRIYVKNTTDHNEPYINITGNITSTLVNIDCPATEKGIMYSFQLQPVNIVSNEHLHGKKTAPTSKEMCYPDEGSSSKTIVGIIVGSAVGCTALLIIAFMFIRWLKKKYDLLKTIKVNLPPGLNTPNGFAPGTYQEFEKELGQDYPYPVQMKQSQVSFSSVSTENRDQTEDSQCSNCSTKELLVMQSGHCDAHYQNPNGGSTNSSTGSHNNIVSFYVNHTHVSADSGPEIDLSPVSVENNVFLKGESQQQLTTTNMQDIKEKSSDDNQLTSENEHELEKKHNMETFSNIARNLPLLNYSYLQPYSKFGVNQIKDDRFQNCSRQCIILPYMRNLTNNEPSFAELDPSNADDYGSSLVPYSKLTFSKSLENLSRNNVGYSKCGIVGDNAVCNIPNAMELTDFNANKHQSHLNENTKFTICKPHYIGIRECLEHCNNKPKPQMPPLTKNTGATVSDNSIDSMANSKFAINASGLLNSGKETK